MIRSLATVIIAVVAGLTTAKFTESAAASLLGAQAPSLGYQLALLLSWLVGGFAASLIALVIGQRWAPLGALVATSMLLGAIVTMLECGLSGMLWPGAAFAVGAGFVSALRLTGATMAHPQDRRKLGLFDE